MSSPVAVFRSVPPNEFKGRCAIIEMVCAQLDHPERRSTALVGGPFTGMTSLLRYMTSKQGQAAYPCLAKSWNIYISGDALGLTTTPNHFWASCFREIQRQVDTGSLHDQVLDMVERTRNNNFDLFNLEDFFDVCADSNRPVVLFINRFENLLRNANFWPPNDFFHLVRSLGQRVPRGLSFVIGTPRSLIDLWEPSRHASPFYNIFLHVPIGRLTEEEVKGIVQDRLASLRLQSSGEIERLVLEASERHPGLVNYVTSLCVYMIQKDGQIEVNKLYREFGDPSGPVVTLIRQIREQLSLTERNWLDLAKEEPQHLTKVQIGLLRKLWEYGLVPPGVSLP